jgi:hypothetical protein
LIVCRLFGRRTTCPSPGRSGTSAHSLRRRYLPSPTTAGAVTLYGHYYRVQNCWMFLGCSAGGPHVVPPARTPWVLTAHPSWRIYSTSTTYNCWSSCNRGTIHYYRVQNCCLFVSRLFGRRTTCPPPGRSATSAHSLRKRYLPSPTTAGAPTLLGYYNRVQYYCMFVGYSAGGPHVLPQAGAPQVLTL